MTGPAIEQEAEALAVLEEAVALLVNLLGWGVALGLAYTYDQTFHKIFQFIANALTQRIPVGFGQHVTISLGGWAKDLDHKFHEWFTAWAAEQEKQVGLWWYALGWTVNEIVVTTEEMAAATARAFKWVANTYVPTYVAGVQDLWKNKSNKAAAAAGAAGALAALLKKSQRAAQQAQSAAEQATRAAARAAESEAHHAKSVATTVENTGTHKAKVSTEVVNVGELPMQFGRTVKQIRRRLGRVEALFGATAMAVAIANVLGIPSWRCLTKGPIGRVSRLLCGMDSALFNLLFFGIAEAFIVSDLCGFMDLMQKSALSLRPGLMELVDVEDALIGCHGTTKPRRFQLPPVSLPAPVGAVSLAA